MLSWFQRIQHEKGEINLKKTKQTKMKKKNQKRRRNTSETIKFNQFMGATHKHPNNLI